jgi:hypothetical protein
MDFILKKIGDDDLLHSRFSILELHLFIVRVLELLSCYRFLEQIIRMMSAQQNEEQKGKVSSDEKNLVVSFIQFLRHKVSANQCTDDQMEGLEGKLYKNEKGTKCIKV